MNNIWLAFITGLTTGGVSCLAVQGGLLASALSTKNENKNNKEVISISHWQQIGAFLIAKAISHGILGVLLGAIGSLILFTPKIMGLIQIFAGLFMVVTAFRLLDVHPIFRYFVIAPPRWTYKILRKTSISGSVFSPFLLGLFSILMPCGVTQAMMALSVASGNAIIGGLILAAFVLGTSPLFFALGAGMAKMLEKKAFVYVASIVIMVMGIMSLNGGIASRGSIYTLQNLYKVAIGQVPDAVGGKIGEESKVATVMGGFQEAIITVSNRGYTSDTEILKVNVPVKLKLLTNNVRSCALAFTIPEFNIQKVLPSTGETLVEFTPTKTGRLAYSCSMGMYTGEFNVK